MINSEFDMSLLSKIKKNHNLLIWNIFFWIERCFYSLWMNILFKKIDLWENAFFGDILSYLYFLIDLIVLFFEVENFKSLLFQDIWHLCPFLSGTEEQSVNE